MQRYHLMGWILLALLVFSRSYRQYSLNKMHCGCACLFWCCAYPQTLVHKEDIVLIFPHIQCVGQPLCTCYSYIELWVEFCWFVIVMLSCKLCRLLHSREILLFKSCHNAVGIFAHCSTHNSHAAVLTIYFDSGLQLIYMPRRPLRMSSTWILPLMNYHSLQI